MRRMYTKAELSKFHPGYVRGLLVNRVNTHNRKARLAGISGCFTVEEWLTKVDEYGGKCSYRGADEFLTMDHRIPYSQGGDNSIDNIVPLCHRCNCSKSDRQKPLLIGDMTMAFAAEPSMLSALDEYAIRTRTSKAEVVRQALAAFLAAQNNK